MIVLKRKRMREKTKWERVKSESGESEESGNLGFVFEFVCDCMKWKLCVGKEKNIEMKWKLICLWLLWLCKSDWVLGEGFGGGWRDCPCWLFVEGFTWLWPREQNSDFGCYFLLRGEWNGCIHCLSLHMDVVRKTSPELNRVVIVCISFWKKKIFFVLYVNFGLFLSFNFKNCYIGPLTF